MEEYKSIAVKVGIFFVAGLILLAWLSLKSEGPGAYRSYSVFCDFKSVENLQEGDNVTLLGVKIGTVRKISIDFEKQTAHIELKIFDTYTINRNAEAEIRYVGIMGRRYVNVLPGTKGVGVLQDGDMLATREPIELHDIMSDLKDIAATGKEMVTSLNENQNRIMGKIEGVIEENRENIHSITSSFAGTAPKIETVAEKLFAIMEQISPEGGTIGRLLYNEEIYDNIREISVNAREISADINTGKGTIGKILKDEELYEKAVAALDTVSTASGDISGIVAENRDKISRIIENADGMAESFRQAGISIQEVAAKINAGEGTIGMLINDPELYEELKKILKNISETFGGGEEQAVMRTLITAIFASAL